jgi:electron transfer flavoprotein alpha subunit
MAENKILVIAAHDHQTLKASTAPTVGAACTLKGVVDMAIIGHDCAQAAEQAAQLAGVHTVTRIDAPHYADQTAENSATVLADWIRQDGYTHVLVPADSFGKNLLPRLSALLGVAPVSDVCRILAPDTFVHPIYAGNILETLRSENTIHVMTVRTTAFSPPPAATSPAPITVRAAGADHPGTRLLERALTVNARPDLTAARVVVSGGRGLGSAENYHALLEPLADTLKAALGASRAAVDAGFVSNDFQVGQTGKIVAPELYLAIGISGAIQHLAGMKDSRVIVAINKDPDAPIFQVADMGLVGDLMTLVPELTAKLRALATSERTARNPT